MLLASVSSPSMRCFFDGGSTLTNGNELNICNSYCLNDNNNYQMVQKFDKLIVVEMFRSI